MSAFGLVVMPPAARAEDGLPKGMSGVPVVGRGLGGMPVRRALSSGPAPLPTYAAEDGVLRVELTGSVYSVVYRKHVSGVPQINGTITQTIATIDNNVESPQKYPSHSGLCVSGDGLVAYVSWWSSATNGIWIRRYSRPDISSNFTYKTQYTVAGWQNIGNVNLRTNVDGSYLFTNQSNYSYVIYSATIFKCTDAAISVLYAFTDQDGGNGSISIQDAIREKKIYFLAAVYNGGGRFGYVDTNTDAVTILDSGASLNTKIGVSIGQSNASVWGFFNKSRSFVAIGRATPNVVICTFDSTGVLSSAAIAYPSGGVLPSSAEYSNVVISRTDDFFLAPFASSSPAYGTIVGTKNVITGVWGWTDTYMTSGTDQRSFSISPSGAYVIRTYGGSQMKIAPVVRDANGSVNQIGAAITTINWTGLAACVFATGSASSFNRE